MGNDQILTELFFTIERPGLPNVYCAVKAAVS